MEIFITLAMILLPVLTGIALPVFKISNRPGKLALITFVLAVEAILGIAVFFLRFDGFTLVEMTRTLSIAFFADEITRLFVLIFSIAWLFVGIYAFVYIQHEGNEDSFFAFYLVVEGCLLGMAFASNLVTMYLFFEMITLTSMPLVLHNRSKESIAAALKYLYYSIVGAFLALFCIFVIAEYTDSLDFIAGGSLNSSALAGHDALLLIAVFLGVIGFGAKAGMYPLHGWLPSAHPVAPAPASAVLSGIIAKAGVLAIIRIMFYCVGTDFLAGTWVQYALIALAAATVFMGSMMAYKEKVFKKRLAYSTVSQISYVLVGLFFMTPVSITGGLMHIIFHAAIKVTLFLVAGSVIFNTGKTRVDELRGIGKEMPITIWSYTIASLALIGIPPASGFVSKWYLATGALDSGVSVLSWLAPVILLISALLTAGYLLPITISGFFPGHDYVFNGEKCEKSKAMWLPIAILSALTLLMGIFSAPISDWLSGIAGLIA